MVLLHCLDEEGGEGLAKPAASVNGTTFLSSSSIHPPILLMLFTSTGWDILVEALNEEAMPVMAAPTGETGDCCSPVPYSIRSFHYTATIKPSRV
jgi:hypothetical protein